MSMYRIAYVSDEADPELAAVHITDNHTNILDATRTSIDLGYTGFAFELHHDPTSLISVNPNSPTDYVDDHYP